MLDLFSRIVFQFVSAIVAQAADFGKNELSRRRNLLSRLIGLFEGLSGLERASMVVYKEFSGYADGSEIVTKVVAGNKLEELNRAYKIYTKKLANVENILEIYNKDLHFALRGVMRVKGRIWKNLDFTEEVLPRMDVENGRRTFLMSYPTFLPEELGSGAIYPDLDEDGLRDRALIVRKEIIQKFKKRSLDLRNSEELKLALYRGKACIEEIREAKLLLGQLIREQFPLNQLIK